MFRKALTQKSIDHSDVTKYSLYLYVFKVFSNIRHCVAVSLINPPFTRRKEGLCMKKKQTTWFGVGVILIAAIFTMTGCGDGNGPIDGLPGKTPLATPANVRVDDESKTAFNLKWDAVQGADSYTLDIGGVLKQVSGSTTSYDLKELTEDPKVYPIKVRAVAYNGDAEHSDSAYSAPIDVEPAEFIFEYEDDSAALQSVVRSARATGGPGTITGLTNYGKKLERIVIPPRIKNTSITNIGDNAFEDNKTMTSVTLPETIIVVGDSAFAGTNITSITLPEAVTNIGSGAFSNCTVLVVVVFVSVEAPDLGANVFDGATAIETIIVPKDSNYSEKIEEAAPELAGKVEEVKEDTKLLISIEVVQPPKTDYTEGEQFSTAGMTVIARYSDNTTSPINGQQYTVQLRDGTAFVDITGNRTLTANDTLVRLSYTEDSTTRITYIPITVTPRSYNITVNAGEGGNITTNPYGQAEAGTRVTITLTANEGYTPASFSITDKDNKDVEWEANETAGYYSLFFTMPASDVTISGTFADLTAEYTITVNPVEGGTITTNPQGKAVGGSTVIITVKSNEGYTLTSLSVGGDYSGTDFGSGPDGLADGDYEFEMPASDVTIYATFTTGGSSTKYTVTFNAGNGAFSDGTNTKTIQVAAGSKINASGPVEAPTRSGYTFDDWTIGSGTAAQDFDYDTPINSDITLNAKWKPVSTQSYTITTNVSGGAAGTTPGTITTNPSGSALAGTTVTFNVSPNTGYTLTAFSVETGADGSTVNHQANTSGGYFFTMPDSDVTITAAFAAEAAPGTITVTFEGFGNETIDLTANNTSGLSRAKNERLSVIVENDGPYDWYVDGNLLYHSSWNGSLSFQIHSYTVGIHTVTVVVTDNGIPYSKELTFRVVH
jgi:uncharacterized repeat protein (TIGR02543 family)